MPKFSRLRRLVKIERRSARSTYAREERPRLPQAVKLRPRSRAHEEERRPDASAGLSTVRRGDAMSFSEPCSTSSKSEMAGLFRARPRASKREPWHGQSQLFSQPSHRTMHFKGGHTADTSCSGPCSSRSAAIL